MTLELVRHVVVQEAIVDVTVRASVKKKVREAIRERRCLSCGNLVALDRRYIRGNCPACFMKLYRKYTTGREDEVVLMRRGVLSATSPGGRPPKSLVES